MKEPNKFNECESGRECRSRTIELEALRKITQKKENQRTISDWGFKTFGYPKNPIAVIDRMIEEVNELNELKEQSKQYNDMMYSKMADECADVYIMLCQIMAVLGYDLHSCVDHKMEINRARKWKINKDGTGQHIKE